MSFDDFELELFGLDAAQRRFRVRRPERSIADAEESELPASLPGLLARLERRQLDRDELRGLGRLLGELLLPSQARADLLAAVARAAHGRRKVRLRLRVDPGLAALPWEFAYVEPSDSGASPLAGFLALQRSLSIVRHELIGEPGGHWPKLTGRVKVAAVLADPGSPEYPALDLAAEAAWLRASLPGDRVDLQLFENGTVEELEQALERRPDVLHFAGHGRFEPRMGERLGTVEGEGFLVLRGDATTGGSVRLFAAADLARNLRSRDVRLVVLGACEAGRRDGSDPWQAIAPTLVREGVPAVVAMQYTVRDANAQELARVLYGHLVRGGSLDEALCESRIAIANRAGERDRDWGVPVLYLRSTESVLFPPSPTPRRVNRALLVAAALVLSCSFLLHWRPLVEQRAMAWFGVPAGLLVVAYGVYRSMLAVTHWEDEAPARWRERLSRAMSSKRALRVTAPIAAAALCLAGSTSSLYLEHDGGQPGVVDLEVVSGQPEGPESRRIRLQVDGSRRRLAGRPIWWWRHSGDLRAVVTQPPGFEVEPEVWTLRPWRGVTLRTSTDVRPRQLRLLRVVPGLALLNRLSAPADGPPRRGFRLEARLDGGRTETVTDLRQGVVYLGAGAAVLEARRSELAAELAGADMTQCLLGIEGSEVLEEMRPLWQENEPELLDSDELAPGMHVMVEVVPWAESDPKSFRACGVVREDLGVQNLCVMGWATCGAATSSPVAEPGGQP